MSLLEIFGEERLVLALKERLLPLLHEFLHLLNIILHLLHQVINLFNDTHALVNKLVDTLRVPSEGVNTWLEGLVDLVNTVLEERLLHWEKGRQDFIIHVDNELKVTSLATINVNLLE
jgi:hypothetical protein